MTTAITKHRSELPDIEEKRQLIKETICRGATDNELDLFMYRYFSKVNITESCWIWTAARRSNGYGVIGFKGRLYQAHWITTILSGRTIPPGLVVDHLCRVKSCVNPAHLDVTTKRENAVRGIPGQLDTHCHNGHQLIPENLYIYPKLRQCRQCAIARSKASYLRNREVAS